MNFNDLIPDLLTIPPSMRQQSAKVDAKPQRLSKFLFEQDNMNSDSTQSLHYLIQQKEQQIDSLQRKYLQIKQVKSRKPQGQNFMHGYLDEYVLQLRDKIDPQVLNELIGLSNSMNEIYRVQQTHLNLCAQRLQQAESFADQLRCLKESDLGNLKKVIQQLQESLQMATVTELDANRLYRDLQGIRLKYAKLQSQFDIISKQNEHTEKNMQSMKHHIQHTNEEALVFKRNLRKEVSQNQFNQRRVFTLEQRLEVLSGSDYKKDKDTLRNIIDDMLKENEMNKRKAFQKCQEVQKLEQMVLDLKEKNQKLVKRNQLLEKQLKIMGYTSYDLNGNIVKQITDVHDSDDEDLEDIFDKNQIPQKLDFKLNNLKHKSKILVQDLIDCGPKQAIDSLYQLDQQNQIEQTIVYMDLFVQYKQLAENVNSIFTIIKEILKQETIEQAMSRLHSQSISFNCECLMLWLIDQQTATFYTYNNKMELVNAFIDADEFLNVVKSTTPIYKQSVYVYRFTNTTKFAKDCYLIPLLNEGRLIGLVSMENLSSKKQDAKYLGLLISHLMLTIVDRLVQLKLINYKLKYKNLIFESFIDLSKCKTRYQFQNAIENNAQTLFGISSCRFYYQISGALHTYTSDTHYTQFSIDQGVVGYVAKTQETILVANIKQHHSFHQNVDISTGLPVFTIPLQFGVMQIVLNQSAQVHQQNKSYIEVRKLLAPNETLQTMAQMFTQICILAYKFIDTVDQV